MLPSRRNNDTASKPGQRLRENHTSHPKEAQSGNSGAIIGSGKLREEKTGNYTDNPDPKTRQKSRTRIIKSLKNKGITNFREKSSPGKKISQMVLELSEPLRNKATTRKQEKITIEIGVMAWNMAVIRDFSGEDKLEELFKKLGPFNSKKDHELIYSLIDRKSDLFGENDEFIFGHQITYLPGTGFNLTVSYQSVSELDAQEDLSENF